MKNTADWVPKEASEFLEPLLVEEVENARKRLAIELWRMRGNLDHFRRCVRELLEYESMRQTWDTVSRRDDIASPVEFCEAFYQLYWCHYRFDLANREEAGPALESLERLYDQTETLLADVNEYLAPEHDREPFWELEPPPDEYLSDLLPLIQTRIDAKKQFIQHSRRFVERMGRSSAKRTHMLRHMSDALQNIYGQRLHAVNAACVGLILNEDPLDDSHVAKVVNVKQSSQTK